MARKIDRLTPLGVKNEKKRGLHADGNGLYLQVSQYDTKSWVFRFTLNKKSRMMGLGPTHTVTLAEAREEARECRKLIRKGIDPIEDRKAERSQFQVKTAKTKTFAECADAYISAHSAAWKSLPHLNQWRSSLKTHAFPVFGDLPVAAVDTGLVMKALEPIWATKTETAGRVRGRIESVLDWATVRNYREGDNPARWAGHLKVLLANLSKNRKVKHFPALLYEEMGAFMKILRQKDGVSARGLEFLILTATRTDEVMGAKWGEVDFDKGIWTISGERMKANTEHRIPLSSAALAVLETMRAAAQSDFIFPGKRANQPLGNASFRQLLKHLGRSDVTAHGFRSTFRDWTAERTAFPRDVAEMALAHTIGDKVEGAYRRGDLFDKRAKLMSAWADYCSVPEQRGDNVTNLRA